MEVAFGHRFREGDSLQEEAMTHDCTKPICAECPKCWGLLPGNTLGIETHVGPEVNSAKNCSCTMCGG
jgi:hypothetical protein